MKRKLVNWDWSAYLCSCVPTTKYLVHYCTVVVQDMKFRGLPCAPQLYYPGKGDSARQPILKHNAEAHPCDAATSKVKQLFGVHSFLNITKWKTVYTSNEVG